MYTRPIGFFDSGVGGTSIWQEVYAAMPFEDTIYLADSNNAPYGAKSADEILGLSIKNTELLLEHQCKIIVVACNTATTNAIDYLRENYDVPFIGIEPAIKPAAMQSNSKAIGVLATKGTLSSALFHSTAKLHAQGIKVLEQEGLGLVPLIEAGRIHTKETRELLQKYLEPMLEKGIDYLVLGCTHYPYLMPVLKEMLPKEVKIIDSGEAVARQTKMILKEHQLLQTEKRESTHQLYTNSNTRVLRNFLRDVEGNLKIAYRDF